MSGVSHPATKVRQEFADFLDDARLRPQYIKRRNSQYIVVPAETFEMLVPLVIKVRDIRDEDEGHYTQNSQFPDVIGFGASAEEALSSFKEGLIDYAYEYYERFPFFSVAPGCSEQAPLILRLVSHFERYGNIDSIVTAR